MELPIKIVLNNWTSTVANANKLLNELTDDQLQADVAPGRNSGTYLLGHLTAVNDRMLPLLGFGEQSYPHYTELFLTSSDKSGKEMPTAAELRTAWSESVARLDSHMSNMQPLEWLDKHTSVSDEDFAKEPHRNKLNVLLGRTSHMANHLGQMVFLKTKD